MNVEQKDEPAFITTVTTTTQWLSQPEFYLEALKRQPFFLNSGWSSSTENIYEKKDQLNKEVCFFAISDCRIFTPPGRHSQT